MFMGLNIRYWIRRCPQLLINIVPYSKCIKVYLSKTTVSLKSVYSFQLQLSTHCINCQWVTQSLKSDAPGSFSWQTIYYLNFSGNSLSYYRHWKEYFNTRHDSTLTLAGKQKNTSHFLLTKLNVTTRSNKKV